MLSREKTGLTVAAHRPSGRGLGAAGDLPAAVALPRPLGASEAPPAWKRDEWRKEWMNRNEQGQGKGRLGSVFGMCGGPFFGGESPPKGE